MMANIRALTLRLVNIDALSADAFFHPLDTSQIYALAEVTIEPLSPALIWRDWSELDASLAQTKLARLRYVQIQVPLGIWRWTNPNFEKFKA
jgi:ABC-type proline/glycine betaine transport system permease subunit